MPEALSRKEIQSAFLGNLFEHYDAALFALLAPFISPLFFPQHDPLSALIMTYVMIPFGMISRPLGSLFFGYIGDHHGRRAALFLSLSGMAIVSCFIALIPEYDVAGFFAPLLLCLGRILQNFFASGETMGGAIFILEHTHEKKHNLIGSLWDSSTIFGILLASMGTLTLSYLDIIETYWRALYLIGCLTGFFGMILRTQLKKISFEEKNNVSVSFSHLLETLWKGRKELFLIMIASGFSYSCYSISLVFMNGFIPLISDITKVQVMSINTFLLVLDMVSLPLFGLLASKFTRQSMMMTAGLLSTFLGIPLMLLLEEATFLTVILVRAIIVTLGVWFSATFYAWSQSLVSRSQRYLIISFGYALGSQLLGGPTAAISLWLFKTTGMVSSAAWWWMALGLFSALAIRLSQTLSYKLKSQVVNP